MPSRVVSRLTIADSSSGGSPETTGEPLGVVSPRATGDLFSRLSLETDEEERVLSPLAEGDATRVSADEVRCEEREVCVC